MPNESVFFLTVSDPRNAQSILYDAMGSYVWENKSEKVKFMPVKLKSFAINKLMTPSVYVLLTKFFGHALRHSLLDKKPVAEFEFHGIEIGRYAVAATLRDPAAYAKGIKYQRRLLGNLAKGFLIYLYAKGLPEDVQYAYLHDTHYLSGIIIDCFLQEGRKVFLKGYPYNIALCDGRISNQKQFLIRRDNREGFSEAESSRYMYSRLTDPASTISYYKRNWEQNESLEVSSNKRHVVIYAHSFTDAQLSLGYDGFDGVYEWLTFTLDLLGRRDVDVLVKGHPNFWAAHHEANVVQWDQEIWKALVQRYSENKNIKFLDYPIDNYSLLKKLNREETLLISHHGNAAVEGASIGFRTLTSVCSLWGDKYKFGVVWRNSDDYREKLLKTSWKFPVDRLEALRFAHDKYMNPNGFHSEQFWLSLVSQKMNVPLRELRRNPSLMKKETISRYDCLVNDIRDSIEEFRD